MFVRIAFLMTVAALSFVRPALAGDTIFKRVEADGSVTFTDQPLEDAVVTVGAPISVIGPSPSASRNVPAGARAQAGDSGAIAGERLPPADAPINSDPGASISPLNVSPAPQRSASATAGAESGTGPDAESDAESGPEPDYGAATLAPSAAVVPGLVADIRIASPHDGAMMLDKGEFAVLQLDATLTDSVSADRLRTEVLVDGEIVADGPLDSVAFPMPEQGTHVLSAQVIDDTGRILATSAPHSVHVKKATLR